MYLKNLSNGNKVWTMGFVLTCDYKTHCSHVIIWQNFFENFFVKWQQSLNNGFCTHMWLQNPLFKLCYHLTSFFVKTKKCHLPFTLELSSFERTFLFYYNVNPVIRKWQHRILLTSSFMLEKFPSHSASPRGLESFLAFMTWWVKSYVVISSSQDWYIVTNAHLLVNHTQLTHS